MFQIAAGRFFKLADINRHTGRSIFHSNIDLFHDMHTSIGVIRNGSVPRRPYSYVHEYVQHHQNAGSTWVWGGDDEMTNQLTAFLSLLLPGFFDERPDVIETICRQDPSGVPRDPNLPSNFIERKTKPRMTNLRQEIEDVEAVLAKLVQLPRTTYEKLAGAALAHKRAIMALAQNHELAYSLLVFALESLSAGEQAAPTWQGLPANERRRYDAALEDLPTNKAEAIRAAILKDRHLRQTKGFIEFIERRLPERFYTADAAGVSDALQPSVAAEALRNAYDIRSKFTHELEIVSDHLRIPQLATGECFQWEGQTYLSFRSLSRILETVFRRIVTETPADPEPAENWNELIPGTIKLRVGHKAMLAATTEFPPHRGRAIFAAIANQIWHRNDEPFSDLRQAFTSGKKRFGNLTPEDRIGLYWSVYLYSKLLKNDLHDDGWNRFLPDNEPDDSWHSLVVATLLDGTLDMSLDSQGRLLDELRRIDRQTSGPRLSRALAAIAGVAVANAALDQGDRQRFTNILDVVRLELAGHGEAQDALRAARDAGTRVQIEQLRKLIVKVNGPKS